VIRMSNQLEELKKLYAVPQTFKIPYQPQEGQEQATIVITPLGLKDLALMSGNPDPNSDEMGVKVKEMIRLSLGVEEDIVDKISFSFMTDLFDAIAKVNNFTKADKEKSGLNLVLERKRMIEEQRKHEAGSSK
jgi:hypothetical protein